MSNFLEETIRFLRTMGNGNPEIENILEQLEEGMLSNKKDILSTKEKKMINISLDEIIEMHKDNSNEINQLAMECYTIMAAGESKVNELAETGRFKNVWRTITGKNKQLRTQKDRSIIAAQYISGQLIVKLSEQNMLTTKILKKTNDRVDNHDLEINNLYKQIEKLAIEINNNKLDNNLAKTNTKTDSIKIGNTVDIIENNSIEGSTSVNLLSKNKDIFKKQNEKETNNIPEWQVDNCIQCTFCSQICPCQAIRPFLLNEQEVYNSPFESKLAVGKLLDGLKIRIQINPLECNGCGDCIEICPAIDKALIINPKNKQIEKQMDNWNYAINEVSLKDDLMTKYTIKGKVIPKGYNINK